MTAPAPTELLPCPFCGAEAVDRRKIDGFPMIYCNGDDCFGPQTTAKTFEDALVQWNTRQAASVERADDEDIGKQIGAYIGMSGIDAKDVAYIRGLVVERAEVAGDIEHLKNYGENGYCNMTAGEAYKEGFAAAQASCGCGPMCEDKTKG